MTTSNRAQINRQNASHSTGPRTTRGKQASSRNSQRHGLLSQSLILPDEQKEDFDQLLHELQCDWNPVGITENLLVERIAVTFWRQRRLVRVENAQVRLHQIAGDPPDSHDVSRHLRCDLFVEAREILAQENLPLLADRNLWHLALRELDCARLPDECPSFSELQEKVPIVANGITSLAGYLEQSPDDWLEEAAESDKGYWKAIESALRLERNRWDYIELKHLLMATRSIHSNTERLHRYQSALDNDIIKIARELRVQQAYRLSSIQVTSVAIETECCRLSKSAQIWRQ